MGSRDYRHHEPKKPKKNVKKVLPQVTIDLPPVEVEVIKKGKKQRGEEEPEEE